MSNEERVSWVTLLSNTVIGCWFFSHVFALPADTDLFNPRNLRFGVPLVVLVIVLHIGAEIVLRIVQRASGERGDASPRDERDSLISLKATRNAYGVLLFAVIAVLAQIALLELRARWPGMRGEPDTILELLASGPLKGMHLAMLLLLALTMAAIALNASRVFYYRRGY